MEILILFWLFIGALVGGMIGVRKNRAAEGLYWGAFLGCIGWIIIALLPSNLPQCPECLGNVPYGATRCMHCGINIQPATKTDFTIVKCPYCSEAGKVPVNLLNDGIICAHCHHGFVPRPLIQG